jgi:hypothetical protein
MIGTITTEIRSVNGEKNSFKRIGKGRIKDRVVSRVTVMTGKNRWK